MSSSTSSSKSLWIATAALAFVTIIPLVYHQGFKKKETSEKEDDDHDNINPSLSTIARRGSKLTPPFPKTVRGILSKCRMAYLSTVESCPDGVSSHLSLMRFTYLHDDEDGEVVIMSTNRKTKKFDMLQKQKGVALLVHDFRQEGDEGLYSITLNGDCRIVSDPKKCEQYRQAHLNHNPEYPQFIVGKDIAILCVDVVTARICDIDDRVMKWEVGDASELRS